MRATVRTDEESSTTRIFLLMLKASSEERDILGCDRLSLEAAMNAPLLLRRVGARHPLEVCFGLGAGLLRAGRGGQLLHFPHAPDHMLEDLADAVLELQLDEGFAYLILDLRPGIARPA